MILLKKSYLIAALTLLMLLVSAVAYASPIKFGMRGDDVQMLQNLLTEKGFYTDEADGVFGNATLQAVRQFQISYGISADGVVGDETLSYLRRASSDSSRYSRALTMSASAYTTYDSGNSQYTCRGNLVRKGIAAVDPSVIPLGTRMYIPGYGYAIADDVGGAIQGNRIDLAFENRSEALEFGRQNVTVYILN